MAVKKGVIKFTDVLAATGAGFASAAIMNQLDKRVPLFTNNKNLAPLANGGLALAMLYFGGSRMEAASFGMLGSTGADFGDALNGMSRLSLGEPMQGELDDLEEALDDAEEEMDENEAIYEGEMDDDDA